MLPIHDDRGRTQLEIDVVCGMEVDPATAEWKTEHEGTTYFFCSKGCLDDFVDDPDSYLA